MSERGSGRPLEGSGQTSGGPVDSDVPWLVLSTGESIRWVGRPRAQSAYPWLALGGLGLLVALFALLVDVVPVLVAAIAPFALVIALWGYLSIERVEFVVTTEALYARAGVLGIRVTEVDLTRVQNTELRQHALARALGYGTISIDTAGGDESLEFWNVEDPQRIRSLIDDRVDRAQGTDVPGSLEQWESVLGEVRQWRRALE